MTAGGLCSYLIWVVGTLSSGVESFDFGARDEDSVFW
jgi:hypothetical protein